MDYFNGLSNMVPGRDLTYMASREEREVRGSYLFLPYIPLYSRIQH